MNLTHPQKPRKYGRCEEQAIVNMEDKTDGAAVPGFVEGPEWEGRTYVEKMADKIVPDNCTWPDKEAINKCFEITEKYIIQIIADTKTACLESIQPFASFSSMHHSAYVEAIEKAEPKEE